MTWITYAVDTCQLRDALIKRDDMIMDWPTKTGVTRLASRVITFYSFISDTLDPL